MFEEYYKNMEKLHNKNSLKVSNSIKNMTRQQFEILDKICINSTERSCDSFDFLYFSPLDKAFKNINYFKTLFFKNFKKNISKKIDESRIIPRIKDNNENFVYISEPMIKNMSTIANNITIDNKKYYENFYDLNTKKFKNTLDVDRNTNCIYFDCRKDFSNPFPFIGRNASMACLEYEIIMMVMEASSFLEDYDINIYDNNTFWKFYNYLKHNPQHYFTCEQVYMYDTHTLYNCIFNMGDFNRLYNFMPVYQLNFIIGVNNNTKNAEYLYPIGIDFTD